MHRITLVASLMALFLLASAVAYGASGDKAKAKGMIIARTGETVILNTADGKTTVVLDDSTKVQHPKGLGLRKQTSKQLRLVRQKHADVLRPFGQIAGLAGQAEVADAIGAPVSFRLDVLHLQRHRLPQTHRHF